MQRRAFLETAAYGAAAWSLEGSTLERLLAQPSCAAPASIGERLATLPLTGDRPRDTVFGADLGGPGLDRRRFTDLSMLQPGRLQTPTAEVFVRTAAPPDIATELSSWGVTLQGTRTSRLAIDALRAEARPMGLHVIECSGNNDPNNFGLLSAVEWTGVPLATLLDRLAPGQDATGVLVTGRDHEASARSSVPGASWILPFADLQRTGAFLATAMNGEPLPLDHGAPVRLVVPGWYGCSWIKWVHEIRAVGPDAQATTQMAEFAGRTHQPQRVGLARDYEAPVIDVAATPIRVEQRLVDGKMEYLVVGVVWGGSRPVTELLIRFDAREAWTKFPICPPPSTHAAWSLWSYRWQPAEAGTYTISLRCADPGVRTRRLDLFFYSRRVRV